VGGDDGEAVYQSYQPTQLKNINYANIENAYLVRAWEIMSLDTVMGNDQTGKKY
jgi:hypothetical protein